MTAMPEDIEALVQRAVGMFWHGPTRPEARPLLQHAVDRDWTHLVAQWFLFQCELIDGDISAARARGQLLVELSPNNPVMVLSLVRALVADGDIRAAQAVVDANLNRSKLPIDRRKLTQNDLIDAILLEIVGRKEDSYRASRAMCREGEVSLLDWSQTEGAAEIRATLQHLRSRVRGRDICIFGRGPSMQRMETEIQNLRRHDFVSILINEFQDVAERILAPLGKKPGLICITSRAVLNTCLDALQPLHSSPDFIALTVPAFLDTGLRSGLLEHDPVSFIISDPHRYLVYNAEREIAFPVPVAPLDFPIVNTLLHALGVAVLLEPRRIFLHGFDGQMSVSTGEFYYAMQGKSYLANAANWQDQTARWLLWDSFRVNHLAPCFVNHLHLLHDVRYPLIFNVCKHSAITCFPRIDFDDYLSLDGVGA